MSKHTEPNFQSMGGTARAKKLNKEQRTGIAQRAAQARWSKDIPTALYQGILTIGDVEIECCVLDGGVRVISQSSFLRAIGRTTKPKGGAGSAQFQRALQSGEPDSDVLDEMPPFLPTKNLKPFISSELKASTIPIEYKASSTSPISLGYKAEILPMVCHVYEDADRADKLMKSQLHIAAAARALSRAFSKTGIIALVDEATGYQYDRARDALARILEKFIAKELQPWTRTFPLEFYEGMFRLNGWQFDAATMQGPRVIGRYTDDVVYRRLAPGVRAELRRKNPVIDGRRKHKHHQWLTGEIGHPKLLAHLEGVKILMAESQTWDEFQTKLNRHYPIRETTDLGFEIEVRKRPAKTITLPPSHQPS